MESKAESGGESGRRPLRAETWETLVDSIIAGECTPFLGAGVAVPYLPRGAKLAADLAEEFEYPFGDVTNLARVTQYIASLYQPSYVKRQVCRLIERHQDDAAVELDGMPPANHVMLAKLGLPIYVTTNYDDYMERAIAANGSTQPIREICRWNDRLISDLGKYSNQAPSECTPMIFHLHGHLAMQSSIVVTEDDYIDFTVSVAQRTDRFTPLLPHRVRRALGNTNLLFVGYSLEDWNFRVLMRHLMKQQQVQPHDRYSSISIQMSDDRMPVGQRARAEKFLEVYLRKSSAIDVYWGDAGDFLIELQRRVDEARPRRRAS